MRVNAPIHLPVFFLAGRARRIAICFVVAVSACATYLRYASAPKRLRLASHRFCFSLALVAASLCSFKSLSAELVIEKPLKMIRVQPLADGSLHAVDKVERPLPVVRDKRVLDAAKMYEKYFLGQMMKAMRSTVNKSDLEKTSMGEGIYREQLDDQYVDSWGERGGIGLADMIHDELLGKAEMMKLRRQAMRAAKGKARTPMALTDRDVMKVRKLPSTKNQSGELTDIVLVSLGPTVARAGDEPEAVRSPWPAVVRSVNAENGKVIIRLETLKTDKELSRPVELVFDGVPFKVTEGDVVQSGQVVGQLGKAARGIILRQTLVQTASSASSQATSGVGALPALHSAVGATVRAESAEAP